MRAMLARTTAIILSAAAPAVAGSASAPTALTTSSIYIPCSASALATAIASASEGTILTLSRFCTYKLASPLPSIAANLIIRGNGATIERSPASGTPEFTMLDVGFDSSVTISNLSFRNAAADKQGAAGAIENDGDLTIRGGSFVGNTTVGFGGAIDNSGTLTVTGATFSRNLSADGGAIENLDTIYISDSHFVNNEASFNGGAVHNEGQATVTDSQFAGNAAVSSGGGIFNGVDGTASTVADSTFQGNRALFGGGVFNEDIVNLTGSLFYANLSFDQGGGIYTNSVLAVTNSKIVRNTAAGGGGIYNGNAFGAPGTVTLTDSTVLANQPDNCEPVSSIMSCRDTPLTAPRSPRPAGTPNATPSQSPTLAGDFSPQPGH